MVLLGMSHLKVIGIRYLMLVQEMVRKNEHVDSPKIFPNSSFTIINLPPITKTITYTLSSKRKALLEAKEN